MEGGGEGLLLHNFVDSRQTVLEVVIVEELLVGGLEQAVTAVAG